MTPLLSVLLKRVGWNSIWLCLSHSLSQLQCVYKPLYFILVDTQNGWLEDHEEMFAEFE